MQTIAIKFDQTRNTSPWGVFWRAAGTRESKHFPSQADAKRFKKTMEAALDGVYAPPGLSEAIRLLLTVPALSILECVQLGIKNYRAGGGTGITVEDACEKYITKLKRDNARASTILAYKKTFLPLVNGTWSKKTKTAARRQTMAGFAGRKLGSITRDQFETWISNPGWAPNTRQHHHRHCRPLWNHLDISFPGDKWTPPYQADKPIRYFSIAEVHLAFLACPLRYRPALALMIFGGIRPEAAWQVRPEWINPTARSVFISEKVDKTSTKDYTINNVPQVLFDWLAAFPVVGPVDLVYLRRHVKRNGGPRWSQDVCRHTAATSWLAALTMDDCRRLLNHSGFSLIRKHYSGDIDKASAEAFLKLKPEDVYPGGDPTWEIPSGDKAQTYLRAVKITPVLVRLAPDGRLAA